MISTDAAIVRRTGEDFEIGTVDLDDVRADEVLIDVVAVGMCHTDLSAKAGAIPFPLPGVLGHEGAGIVRAVGDAVRRVSVGDRVLMTFTSCGTCPQCRGGHPALCTYHLPWNLLGGLRSDGTATIFEGGEPLKAHFFGQSSFANQAIVDERSVIRLSDGTSDDDLVTYAPLGCGLQTGAGAVFNVIKPRYDTTLLVSGAGAVGLAAVMAGATTPARRVIIVDVVESRLELARELGASDVIDAKVEDMRQRVAEITDDQGVDAAIETTGNVGVLESAIDSLSIGGVCAIIGAPSAGLRATFDVNAFLPGRRIVGITLGDSDPQSMIPELIRLHKQGRFPIERLEKRYPFTEINDAAHDAISGETIKPVLLMGEQNDD